MRFRHRKDAGEQLAGALRGHSVENPVVLGLPRGGVPVAFEVARDLGAPFDVLVARKLSMPWGPELALGAVAEDGVSLVDADMCRWYGVPAAHVEQLARHEIDEIRSQLRRYAGPWERPTLQDRTVILIDDGIATGVTARAAIRSARKKSAKRIIFAAPVATADAVTALQSEADEVACIRIPAQLSSIGRYYEDFPQVTEEEVISLIHRARLEANRQVGAAK